MKKCFLWCAGAWMFVLLLCVCAFAQPASIDELIVKSTQYDAKEVVIEGEAIGHLMRRGEFAWLNVSDGKISIGIWAKQELFRSVEHLGRYAVKGDQLRIRGIFHTRCVSHGGDTDIHAQTLAVVASGNEQHSVSNPKKKKILVVLIGIFACLYTIKILKRQR